MDKQALTNLRDQAAAMVAAHQAAEAQSKIVLDQIDAELNRDPTLADVQSILGEVIARQSK